MEKRTIEKSEESEIIKLLNKHWKAFLVILLFGATVGVASKIIDGRPITWRSTVEDAFGLLGIYLVWGVVETALRVYRDWSEFFDDWKKRHAAGSEST